MIDANIDSGAVKKIFKLVKQIGLYESIKAILSRVPFRGMIVNKLKDMSDQIIQTYQIQAHSFNVRVDGDLCYLTVELHIPDSEKRKLLRDRLHNTVKNSLEQTSISPLFIEEFNIKDITCEEIGDKLKVVVVGNKRLGELIKSLGGDVDYGEEQKAENSGEEG